MGQIGMQHRQKQSVGADAPNHRHGQQDQGQNADFRRADGQNIADEVVIELGKAPAAPGCNENAQCHCGRRKNADHRISGQIGTPAHIGKQQRKHRRQQHRHPQRKCHAANGADGNARKGRMPQRVREKAHVSRDHMAAQKAQQRAEHQNAQQCVFHKQHGARLRPFKGK